MELIKTLIVGLDGILCEDPLLNRVNDFMGTDYEQDDFDVEPLKMIANKKGFSEYYLSRDAYDDCTVYQYAPLVMKELMDRYDVYIQTPASILEFPKEAGMFLAHKYRFLQEKFPFIDQSKYIFAGTESIMNRNCRTNPFIFNPDVRIDVSLEMLKDAKAKLLYTSYLNNDLGYLALGNVDAQRVDSWPVIRKVLSK